MLQISVVGSFYFANFDFHGRFSSVTDLMTAVMAATTTV